MRRILGIALTLFVSVAALLLATAASDGGGSGYKVRAIFNNAFSVIPGEDLKIAGVKVGKIESLDVTPDQKAAVVLRVDKAGFGDWRTDAHCTIRPQSLIGEKFVECTPTQPRPVGAPLPPLLPVDPKHSDQHLLPATHTSRPIDIDLLNNILRLPYRQRLTIIINELGTGLAGRGADLNRVIRNADPALAQTDKVLKLLAGENRVLADLARDSDAALAPIARERRHVTGFIRNAGITAQATAERSRQFEKIWADLPAFLRQLKPTMVRLGALSDEMTPVLTDLGAQAPAINRWIISLGPFATASTPAVTSLGKALVPGRKALIAAKPITQDLKTFGNQLVPLSSNLSSLLTSLRSTGGIERLMDFLFYSTAAVNGYDSYGHYLRAQLIVNNCSTYAIQNDPACTANFQKSSARAASARDDSGRTPALVREDRVLAGESVQQVLAGMSGQDTTATATKTRTAPNGARALPQAVLPSQVTSPPQAQSEDPSGALLDYLMGDN
jgi:phospholipid/cholesterol/gamma-HCH transport system substrate-binding protein